MRGRWYWILVCGLSPPPSSPVFRITDHFVHFSWFKIFLQTHVINHILYRTWLHYTTSCRRRGQEGLLLVVGDRRRGSRYRISFNPRRRGRQRGEEDQQVHSQVLFIGKLRYKIHLISSKTVPHNPISLSRMLCHSAHWHPPARCRNRAACLSCTVLN